MTASTSMRSTESAPERTQSASAVAASPDPAGFVGFGYEIQGPMNLIKSTTSAVAVNANNVTTTPSEEPATYDAQTFDTRAKVMESYSASVSASYSGVAFSGEFAATYGSQSSSDESVAYGRYDVTMPVEDVKLTQNGPSFQTDSFKSDPDVSGLPTTFSPETQEQFFRVFRRFGTHVVTGIRVGGWLHAYSTAQVSETMSAATASANMSLEYQALFADVSGQAKADWSTLGDTWMNDRKMTFTVLGGDKGPLAGFEPAYGANAQGTVATWIASVKDDADIAGFTLARLSMMFDGPLATAVDLAIDAYVGGVMRVAAAQIEGPGSSTVSLPGQGLATTMPAFSNTAPPPAGGVQPYLWVLLMDPSKPLDASTALLNKAYYTYDPDPSAQIDADITAATANVTAPLVVLTGTFPFYLAGVSPPAPPAVQQLVQNCGFDLNDFLGGMANDETIALMSIVGKADHGVSPCSVNYAVAVPDPNATVNAVVGLYTHPITVVEQSGTVLSPGS